MNKNFIDGENMENVIKFGKNGNMSLVDDCIFKNASAYKKSSKFDYNLIRTREDKNEINISGSGFNLNLETY